MTRKSRLLVEVGYNHMADVGEEVEVPA